MEIRIAKSGIAFECIGTQDYIRKDGGVSVLNRWQAHCRKCGSPFELTTGVKLVPGISKCFEIVHCTQHRLNARQRTYRWRKAIKKQSDARRRSP